MKKKIVIICGPTAVGKTKFSIEIGKAFNGEIVSADSMQLYKFMDIGSAKPTKEDQEAIPHHLIDEIDPLMDFSVVIYKDMAKARISDIFNRGKTPIIVGGTGLYVNSLIYDMDFSIPPISKAFRNEMEELAKIKGNEFVHNILKEKDKEAADNIHPNSLKRVIRALEIIEKGSIVKPFNNSFIKTTDYDYILIGLQRERQLLYDRINERVDILMAMGLLDEVTSLLNKGLTESNISMKGIGYKELIGHINGEYDLEYAIELIKKNTRHYAKRQLTWFRRYEDIKWFNISDYENEQLAIEEIIKWLKQKI